MSVCVCVYANKPINQHALLVKCIQWSVINWSILNHTYLWSFTTGCCYSFPPKEHLEFDLYQDCCVCLKECLSYNLLLSDFLNVSKQTEYRQEYRPTLQACHRPLTHGCHNIMLWTAHANYILLTAGALYLTQVRSVRDKGKQSKVL